MKIETYLNAYERAEFERAGALLSNNNPKYHLRTKQAAAFRARILRMFAEKDEIIGILKRGEDDYCNSIRQRDKHIDVLRAEHDFLLDGSRELKAELDEKDQMIRDMAWLTYCDQVTDTGMTEHIIGHGKEYADADDWIESYIEGLKHD